MDKQQEESRRQFEKEMASRGWSTQATSTGDYVHERVALMWEAWQASRASIVVDIDWPEANDDHWKSGEEGAYAQGYEMGKDLTAAKVRSAIRSIGLSIKGE